ncbi:flavin-dependent oxidoreductase [Paraburkholderia bonniea]|uniref:flavin-dependent oxidoreductase n=1 Tax=Paraburkholderia bonniea TaxID=2152891 RepID=UPI002573A9BC|nr:flavin-dependent oxidoreductase [Paraburkholderia bonniea]WJF91938.1 flavin-dependent oxidoreductase [Paraburkholderia bonniea]WJF95257.1 flavin-dependent oxidoreductase [Paraburkholderia bonniea]
MQHSNEVIIVGAGIGGLTLALTLHKAGIACRIFEAAPEIKPLGVGINLLPHATSVLAELGLIDALAAVAVTTQESAFFNRHGQLIYREPAGRFAGYEQPQFSIHRGDLQTVLLNAVLERLGADRVLTDRRCLGATANGQGVSAEFADRTGVSYRVDGAALVACDGVHSVIRKQFYPDEGAPRYSGVNMWRGTIKAPPFLTGASMVRAGWLTHGKMVIYPIRNNVDDAGNQLVNWVAEIEAPQPAKRDWNGAGRLADFFPAFADWHFDWLDVAAMIESSEAIYEYPMVDQDPLPRWTFGRITLLGDAAHPMVPRGSNGAGQAILDAQYLAQRCAELGVSEAALMAYDHARVKATGDVVLMNRKAPPDRILQVIYERTQGERFERIEDVASAAELSEIANQYKRVAGFHLDDLKNRGTAESGAAV